MDNLMKNTKLDERINLDSYSFERIHNESRKLPGHEERMKAHTKRIQKGLREERKKASKKLRKKRKVKQHA